ADRIGVNHEQLASGLRQYAFGQAETGAAHVRWPVGEGGIAKSYGKPFAVLALVRQSIRWQNGTPIEVGVRLHVYAIDRSGALHELTGQLKGDTVRALLRATQRIDAEQVPELV